MLLFASIILTSIRFPQHQSLKYWLQIWFERSWLVLTHIAADASLTPSNIKKCTSVKGTTQWNGGWIVECILAIWLRVDCVIACLIYNHKYCPYWDGFHDWLIKPACWLQTCQRLTNGICPRRTWKVHQKMKRWVDCDKFSIIIRWCREMQSFGGKFND